MKYAPVALEHHVRRWSLVSGPNKVCSNCSMRIRDSLYWENVTSARQCRSWRFPKQESYKGRWIYLDRVSKVYEKNSLLDGSGPRDPPIIKGDDIGKTHSRRHGIAAPMLIPKKFKMSDISRNAMEIRDRLYHWYQREGCDNKRN
ncbi:hypothetical protein HAX54_044800 [Datura stramonium]|uniref:Uncharacterized protein n=1 Tax=Datura stramonium TaxID=4076 RepID=A0ABS8WH92_DATST|nr:hypothetical protein [Datura stramonium]